jgi:hypothetical protein
MIKTPFEAGQKSKQDEPPIQEISWKYQSSRKFLGSLAYRYDGYQTQVEKGEEARISQPSGDVWYGNSWHDFGESDATTTRPEPGARTKKRARSAVQGDGAPREWSGEAEDVEQEWKTWRSQEEKWGYRRLHKSL